MHLDAYRIDQEVDTDGLASRVPNGFSLGLAKPPAAGIVEQAGQLGQVKVGDFLGRDRFLQQSTRRLQEHAGKERFVLGKNAV